MALHTTLVHATDDDDDRLLLENGIHFMLRVIPGWAGTESKLIVTVVTLLLQLRYLSCHQTNSI